jgi:orotidine-5'-phosphate decarboxylase
MISEPDNVFRFNEAIIKNTSDLVCAYKPNSAFYEALGSHGIDMLRKTCAAIPKDIPVILDIKRGDISNTARKYVDFAYNIIGADAVTVNPYMGFDAVKPFLREGKCVFVLCLTSNVSSRDFQLLATEHGPLYERVAQAAREWSNEGEIGLVVGATKSESMTRIREIVGEMPILVPGVGAQGGDIESTVKGCGGKAGMTIINSSRGILYASAGSDFQEAARASLLTLRNTINTFREK